MNKRTPIFAIALMFLFSLSGKIAIAAEAKRLMPDCGTGDNPCTICHLFELINNIITIVVAGLVPAAAILVISIAGFKMIVNQNNAEVLAESRKIILMVVIGLVLIFGSFAIVNSTFKMMGYVGGNPLELNNVNCPKK